MLSFLLLFEDYIMHKHLPFINIEDSFTGKDGLTVDSSIDLNGLCRAGLFTTFSYIFIDHGFKLFGKLRQTTTWSQSITSYTLGWGMPSLALYMLCFFFAFFKGLSRPGWFQLPLALCYSITNFLGLRRIWIRTPWVWSSSKGRENWPTWSWMKLFSRIYWSFHLGCISARSHVTEYPLRYDFPDLRWLFLIFLVCIRLSVGFFLFKMYHLALSPRDT